MAGDAKTSAEYSTPFTNLTYGRLPDGSWGSASAEEAAAMGFFAVHVDSMAWSMGLGLFSADPVLQREGNFGSARATECC